MASLVNVSLHDNKIEIIDEKPLVLPVKKWTDYITVSIFCFLVAFGGFVFGYDTGTISGFINMSDFINRFGDCEDGVCKFTSIRVGLIISMFNIGSSFGALVLSKIGDTKGRRVGIMTAMAIYVVGITIQISSTHHWYQYMLGRIVSGMAVGCVTVLCPMFIGETAPKSVRGALVFCFQLCVTLGIVIGYIICYKTRSFSDSSQWRVPLGLCYGWAMICVIGMCFMHESPRFLVMDNQLDKAKVSISKANRLPIDDKVIKLEIKLIQASIAREKLDGNGSWSELIYGEPRIFYRVCVGVILSALNQLSGIDYFFYYGTTIFTVVGIDSFKTSIILGTVNFFTTFIGIYIIDKLGRRKCLLIGSFGMSICFLVYSVLGTQFLFIDGFGSETRDSVGDALIFVTTLFIFFFGATWAGVNFAVQSELYPLRIRTKAISLAILSNYMANFFVAFCTSFITAKIHFYYGYVFFGCIIFSIFFVYFFIYETKDLTLEEIDLLFSSKVPAMKSSKWVPPNIESEVEVCEENILDKQD